MNGQYLMRMTAEQIYPHLVPFLGDAPQPLDELRTIIDLHKMRARTLREIAEQMAIYFVDDDAIEYDADAVKKHIKGDDLGARMSALHDALASTEPFDVATSEAALRKRRRSAGRQRREAHPPAAARAHRQRSVAADLRRGRGAGEGTVVAKAAAVDRAVAGRSDSLPRLAQTRVSVPHKPVPMWQSSLFSLQTMWHRHSCLCELDHAARDRSNRSFIDTPTSHAAQRPTIATEIHLP